MSENNQEVNVQKPKQDFLSSLAAVKRELIIGVSLLIIASIGYGSFKWLEQRKELKASESYYRIKMDNGFTENNKTLKETATQENLKAFILKNSDRAVAKDAAIELSKYFDEAKDYKSAYETLSMIKKFKADNLVDNLYQYRLAISMQKNNDCKGAVDVFAKIAKNRKFAYLNAPSLLQEALCHEKLGNKDKAVSTYENIITTYGDTDAGKQAEKYLILIKMGV